MSGEIRTLTAIENILSIPEEAVHHVHDSLLHLHFWADLANRTRLYDKLDDYGWAYGGSDFHGSDNPWQVYDEQATTVAKILFGDKWHAELAWPEVYQVGVDLINPLFGHGEEHVGEENLVAWLYAPSHKEAARFLADREKAAWTPARKGKPRHAKHCIPYRRKTKAEMLEDYGNETAEYIENYYHDDDGDNKCAIGFVLEWAMYEPDRIYEWVWSLVEVWEERNARNTQEKPEDGQPDPGDNPGDGESPGDAADPAPGRAA